MARFEQRIYAMVLYLVCGNRDVAYEIVVSTFVEVLRGVSEYKDKEVLLARLAAVALQKCRMQKTEPVVIETSNFEDRTITQGEFLNRIRQALQSLPFEIKALLILRDQVHLPHAKISAILDVPEKKIRQQVSQARSQLRNQIEKNLRNAN